jgi:cysteine-rich repeat protein
MLNGDCSTCHAAAARFPVAIGSSAGGTGLGAYGCAGCHGRAEDGAGGGTVGFGAALRQHHYRAGETTCLSCHNDANPANKTVAGENVLPPYYANPGTNHPNMPANTCTPTAAHFENFAGSTRGLDNDGDSLYDLADSDCAATTAVCGNGRVEAGEQCDDGNTTAGDCCSAACQYEAAGSACSDGFFCTVGETCNGAGACAGGTARNCADALPCTTDTCNETGDVCAHAVNDAACNDGNPCNGAETCNPATGCAPGTPLNCDDASACTTDSCSPTAGCQHAAVNCDDANTCTTDSCSPTAGCQHAAVNCNDANACTTDSCNPASGCAHAPVVCDDGLFCNGAETCNPATGCQAGTPPSCADTNICTDDSCNTATNQCDHIVDPTNDPSCVLAVCGNGRVESGEQCDDGNTTAGDCCSPTCRFEAAGSACSDALYCTVGETCNGSGACAGGAARDCADAVPCTTDSCDDTADSCVHGANDAACADGNVCNGSETCNPASGCVAGTQLNCSDGDACTADSCSPVTGCAHAPVVCDDGAFCNGAETCSRTLGCLAGTPPDCSDADICTDDSCSPSLNRCDHVFDPMNDPSCLTAPETACFDGIDNDNDGSTDCADSDCLGASDGPCQTGQPGVCAAGTYECRDLSRQCMAHGLPQPELCSDGLDNDCDGLTDGADPDCQAAIETDCFDGLDNDADGSTDCADPDCAGARDGACPTGLPGICAGGTAECSGGARICRQNDQPGAELCNDGLDNDCDGSVDTADPDCPAMAADVWVEDLRIPRSVKLSTGSSVTKQVSAVAEADLETQQATVSLRYAPINAVTVNVTPATLTLPVTPGDASTQFRFSATITCNQPGEWAVSWTATITAPGNRDSSNDTVSGQTNVTCRSRGSSEQERRGEHRDSERSRRGH